MGIGRIVVFEPSISCDIQWAGNLKSTVLGGEGLFLATLTGLGPACLQSLPFSRLADRIGPLGGDSNKAESSIIGRIPNILER